MSNDPAPREVPPGKVLVSDYRYGPAERAMVETIAEAFAPHVAIRANVRLEWSSPGFEPAGSLARWTNGYWAVRWTDRSGATQGRRYRNDDHGEAEARAHFARITQET